MEDFDEMDSDEIPDMPINNNASPELLKALISNEGVPNKIRRQHFQIFNNDITLSFQDEKTKKQKMLDFDLTKIDYLMATPWFDYTFEQEQEWNQIRTLLDIKLDRAVGFKGGGRTNERLVQQTQFGEQKVIKSIDSSSNAGGIFASILGRKR